MRDRPLSSSSMKTFLQCVLKYYYQYEDKKPRIGRSTPLAFGSAVHEALEEMHKITSETGHAPTAKDYNKVLDVFMNSAVNYGLDDLDAIAEGKTMLISRLNTVNPEDKIIGLELKFELETPNGTPFLGSIDKLLEIDEETVAVIDYKTSRMALTQEEADKDIQLSMYDLAVSMMYPQYKTIVCALDYLRLNEVITHRTPEQRKNFVRLMDAVYQQILNTKKDDVVPSLNGYCGWCDFNNFCPSYQALVTDPDLVLPRVDGMTDEEFVDSFEAYNAAKKILNSRYNVFKGEAYRRLQRQETVKGKTMELYKTQTSRKDYNSAKVFNIVGPEAFRRMASVSKNAVERYIRDNPDEAEELESAATYPFNAPSFKTRKIKDK